MLKTQQHDREAADNLVQRFDARPEKLVQILHAFVDRFGYISQDAVRQIADLVNLSVAEVYGVVHFYDDFGVEPPGKRVVKICQAEACQAMGSRELTTHAESLIGIKLNSTTEDKTITLRAVYCLGNCACSPSVMVDSKIYGRVNTELFNKIITADNNS